MLKFLKSPDAVLPVLASLSLCLISISAALPTDRTQKSSVYELGRDSGAPIYTQVSRYRTKRGGETRVQTLIRDPAGKLVVEETATYTGSRLQTQDFRDHLRDRWHHVEVRDGRVYFNSRPLSGEGAIEENDENAGPDLIAGPTLEPFLQEHWDALLAGEIVSCNFVVPDREDVYGFDVSVRGNGKVNGRESVQVEMRPKSPIVSLGLRPIRILMDLKTRQFVQFNGRTPLSVRKGEELEPLDATVVFR